MNWPEKKKIISTYVKLHYSAVKLIFINLLKNRSENGLILHVFQLTIIMTDVYLFIYTYVYLFICTANDTSESSQGITYT